MIPKPDLAGIYITDDAIDAIVGSDRAPSVPKATLSGLQLDPADDVDSFPFAGRPIEATIDEACRWIAAKAPRLRSLGVACYGPFFTIARKDRDADAADYGRLQASSRGRLQRLNLSALFREALSRYLAKPPLITVDTDVSAAVIGEVYNRSRKPDGSRDRSVDDQVFVFVKVSFGIGAAFLRARTTWHGRLHTEGGQFHVPRWPADGRTVGSDEAAFAMARALNPGSIEGLASLAAIEARFKPLGFDQLRAMPGHVAWDREAWYLAHMLWTLTCVVSPHRIVLGGRVMAVEGLIGKVRRAFASVAGSPPFPHYAELDNLESYIAQASESDPDGIGRPGIVGALCTAAMEHRIED